MNIGLWHENELRKIVFFLLALTLPIEIEIAHDDDKSAKYQDENRCEKFKFKFRNELKEKRFILFGFWLNRSVLLTPLKLNATN
jgi:hypothetical protein